MNKKDAPEVIEETGSSEVLRITWQNLDGTSYMPTPGMEYEIAEGCIRIMNRPFYDVELTASSLSKKENLNQTDVTKSDYAPTVRMDIMEMVTYGDDIPEKGVDMLVVSRVVIDFFTMRIYKGQKLSG
ncbi:hypothetical protein OAF54_02730 [bacterium]|nr:hypothetical protein [bacterium]